MSDRELLQESVCNDRESMFDKGKKSGNERLLRNIIYTSCVSHNSPVLTASSLLYLPYATRVLSSFIMYKYVVRPTQEHTFHEVFIL